MARHGCNANPTLLTSHLHNTDSGAAATFSFGGFKRESLCSLIHPNSQMAKKSAAKPAAAEELKAKKDIQKAVKLETKKKVRPRWLYACSRRICRNRVAEYCHATPLQVESSSDDDSDDSDEESEEEPAPAKKVSARTPNMPPPNMPRD